jgi:hypothetical protein
MLAHSPPLPLTIDYISENDIAAEDEEGILLALEQGHRVRHLRLVFPVQNLRKLVVAIDEEFPILEYLIAGSLTDDGTALMLPGTLQAPNLLHLKMSGFAYPIRPRLHPTAVGLVTLCITIRPSAYFQPNVPLQWISFMPQLEDLAILFTFPVPNRDVERQLTRTPITTRITLPNLRSFRFHGVSAYLEAVVCLITAPRLENLQIRFFEQLTFSIPRLSQFMNTTDNLRFDKAVIEFQDNEIDVQFPGKAGTYAFGVKACCWHLDWQVSAVAQISNALSQVFSTVEDLTLGRDGHFKSSEEHNNVDRIEWRNLLRSFSNVKTLHVKKGLVKELSHCLRLEDGELPLELLPELQELTYFVYPNDHHHYDAFTPVVDARQSAGRPVALVRRRIELLRRHEVHIPSSYIRDVAIESALGFRP